MGRWTPGAAERLQAAGIELFAARGFEQVTAAEIAAAAGLTQRTFFRHFADKRELVFRGQEAFVATAVGGVLAAPAGTGPLDCVLAGVAALSLFFTDERRPWSRLRQGIIDAEPALQERERHKLAGLATEVAAALRRRGHDDPVARTAAEVGTAVLGLAFGRWVADGEDRSFDELAAVVLAELRAVVCGGPAGA